MQSSTLIGDKAVLVPFTLPMVDKYADWMADPHLCELTASDPMTKAEVLNIQK